MTDRGPRASVTGISALSLPNKSVLPTATTRLDRYSPDSGRRHIGQPLGGQEGERRPCRTAVGARAAVSLISRLYGWN